jgi:hypothetical protein
MAGTITATDGKHRWQVSAGKNGAYTLVLPVGRYTVTGTSPGFGDGKTTCTAYGPVIVRKGAVTRADVYCLMI